ncbi:MAG: DUF971 domain-containing protein, partial [Hyphomicrobiales bacterium]|nr:DUF971 domain-containing protein [Hyphomicrobiales bacterium]
RLREASRSVDARRVAPGPGREVTITGVQPVGNYAVQLAFDDGHDTGIYDWPTLRALGAN